VRAPKLMTQFHDAHDCDSHGDLPKPTAILAELMTLRPSRNSHWILVPDHARAGVRFLAVSTWASFSTYRTGRKRGRLSRGDFPKHRGSHELCELLAANGARGTWWHTPNWPALIPAIRLRRSTQSLPWNAGHLKNSSPALRARFSLF